jgi:hypothetical protein
MCRPSIEPRDIYRPGCRRGLRMRKATSSSSPGRDELEPRGVRDLEHAQKHLAREPGDPVPTHGGWRRGSRWEAGRHKPAMNGYGKSDGCDVPAKPSNKRGRQRGQSYGGPYAGTKAETPDTDKGTPKAEATASQPTAEVVEGRHPAERNLRQQTMRRHRAGHACNKRWSGYVEQQSRTRSCGSRRSCTTSTTSTASGGRTCASSGKPLRRHRPRMADQVRRAPDRGPRRRRLSFAWRPNSMRRVLSGCSSSPNLASRCLSAVRNCSAS